MLEASKQSRPGRYIVIEGTDGSGKTTICTELARQLSEQGIDIWLAHEPGGTAMAEAIRSLVKDGQLERQPMTNLLLFMAARVELIAQIEQCLEAGQWVIASRNYLSSIAYQGIAQGLGEEMVVRVCQQFLPERYLQPDLTAIIDVDYQLAEARRRGRDRAAAKRDAFESREVEFQQKLVQAYRHLASRYQLPLLDGRASVVDLTKQINQLIAERALLDF